MVVPNPGIELAVAPVHGNNEASRDPGGAAALLVSSVMLANSVASDVEHLRPPELIVRVLYHIGIDTIPRRVAALSDLRET